MKFIVAYSALLVASLSTMGTADLGVLEIQPISYYPMDQVIYYWTDSEYKDFDVQLVVKIPDGWDKYDTIASFSSSKVGNSTCPWPVREVPEDREYAIWFTAQDASIPMPGGEMEGGKATGYAFLTNSFEIRRYEQKPLLSGRQIAGITVGCLAFCAAIAGALFVVVRRKRTSRSAQEVAPARAEWRDSVDSIAVEKERARVATMETNA